jgi:hypothetical protein
MQSGVACRGGPFKEEEIKMIRHAIQEYQKVCYLTEIHMFSHSVILIQEHNLDDGQLDDLMYSSDLATGFWSYVGQLA